MKKLAADLEKGVIGANQAIDLILQGMKEFDGMMDRTANETVEGLWSTIEDTFEINIFRRWGQGLQDGAKRGFGSVVTLLDEADTALVKFGDTVYEVGKEVSNWVADKFENAVKRITDITDSFEFKNASLGERLSMLWDGVIVDPLKEWWEGGGQAATAKTAGNIGKWMGEFITDGLLALFGATDVLDDGIGTNTGKSIAGSFLRGFLDNFDGSAITDAFVDAVSNVWNALPWWGKMLVGGYGVAKGVGLINSVVGGAATFLGGAGAVVGGASAGTGLLGLGSNTAIALGAGNLAGGASLGAGALSALGLGAIAGGVATGAGLFHAGTTGYQAYKAYKQGDTQSAKANATRSGFTLAGIGGGALLGAKAGASIGAIGGPLGALLGAGLGTAVGWFAGDKIARNIEAAKYESEAMQEAIKDSEKSAEEIAEAFEKAKWENAKKHFGDMKLSLTEIERLCDQIVWGGDLESFEKLTSATQNAEANLQSLKKAAETADRWMWKAGLGVKFNDDEQKSIKAAFDDYIGAAKSYVENKHYEFTAAVSMLVDIESEEGKSIIASGDAYYTKIQDTLKKLGENLSDKVEIALKDGVITLNEQAEITNLQKQIAEITSKISSAEQQAEIELIKVKFGNGKMDIDSFENFMSTMQTTIEERIEANDKAFVTSVSSLQLQLKDGAISKEEYDKQLQTLINGYNDSNAKLKAEIKDVELEIVGDAYSKELGDKAKENLEKALQYAVDEGLDPVKIEDKKLFELLEVEELSKETTANIKEMLSKVTDQLGVIPIDINGELYFKTNSKVDVENLAREFGIPEEHAETVAMLLYGEKELLNQIDVSELAKEFGIPEEQAKTIIEKLTGEKSIQNKIDVLASDFGIPDVITKTVQVKIKGSVTAQGNPKMDNTAKQALLYNQEQQYRGGIVGGSSSYEAFADGGIVRGGARLVKVAEEGSPEMIIPLSSQRRQRGLKLWQKAGEMLGVDGFFRGGRTDNGDESIRLRQYSTNEPVGSQPIKIDVGGINLTIQANGTGNANIIEEIKAQAHEIAEVVTGIIADSLSSQFENTPVRGGT